MNPHSLEPSDTRESRTEVTQSTSAFKASSDRPSPVDSPYTNARSPSGHLIPYSPTPTRRYSRDHVSRLTGSQTSLHEEPSSINHDAPQVITESILRTDSNTTVHTHHDNYTPSPDIRMHLPRPPSPLHPAFGFAAETYPGTSEQSAHVHFDRDKLPHHRNELYSIKSTSQLSLSQKSYNSGSSIGRASYREHRGPPARDRTPSPDPNAAFGSPFPIALGSNSAVFQTIIAPPCADDPNRPGEPTLSPRFFPMSVSGVVRYDDHRKMRPQSEPHYNIKEMSYQYPETPDVPEGWTAYRHPEGALYFVHTESKTMTEVNICDDDIHGDIEYFRTFLISELKAEIKKRNLSETLKLDEIQLVVEPKRDNLGGVMCCYYFVNPPTRSLFWLDEWCGDEIFKDCRSGWQSKHNTGVPHWVLYDALMILSNSRSHWDLYPNFCEVTQELKDEVVDMILHAICDHLTSITSSCPLSAEELKNYLALVREIDIDPKKTRKRGHCAIIIGRIMHIFYHAYFLNYYGEDCARLNSHQTVHGWRYQPSLFMTVFAPLLFMAPVNNVRLLHRLFVDNIVRKDKWNVFVTKLNSQLQETSVLATVLLNANVGFLPKESGTPQEYLSYMSLVTSMASIILGLVFMGNIRTEERNTPFKAATFLYSLRHERHGLEALAIVYSLPRALLMWGMLLFFAAFAVEWCYPDNTLSRACVGAFMLIVALLVALCTWTARDRSDSWWFQPDSNPAGTQEYEGEQGNHELSLGVPLVGLFYKLMALLIPSKSIMSQSVATGENYAMQ